jgi:sterol desaturase/sphingolipid hydroxylase (fatty acid hydroxylase superfamily)
MPEDSFVGRLALVRVLREHHRRHHHPALMQRWNFNVTLPLFDWLYKTRASDDLVQRVVEASRQ